MAFHDYIGHWTIGTDSQLGNVRLTASIYDDHPTFTGRTLDKTSQTSQPSPNLCVFSTDLTTVQHTTLSGDITYFLLDDPISKVDLKAWLVTQGVLSSHVVMTEIDNAVDDDAIIEVVLNFCRGL